MRMNNMGWGTNENRAAIVALHHCGMPPTKIMKTLTLLCINERLVFHILSRYKEMGNVCDPLRLVRPLF